MTKLLFSYFFLTMVGLLYATPSLETLRTAYEKCKDGTAASMQNFIHQTESITKNDTKVLIAYRGAALLMKGKMAKGIGDKKRFSKEGISWIESACTSDPSNVEIRFLRLSLQENLPKIVGYRKNITEDKKYILTHLKNQTDALRKYIANYLKTSTSLTTQEKQQL